MEPLHRLLGIFCGSVALAALIWVGRYSPLAALNEQRAKAEEARAWEERKPYLQAVADNLKERERRQQHLAAIAWVQDQIPQVADKPPFPKLSADAFVFNLGTLHVDKEFRHKFTIRNSGVAPLILHRGPVGCHRVIPPGPPRRDIPPGGSVELEITGTPREVTPAFAKTSGWRTNDPARRELELKVYGSVIASERSSNQ
jgi:hypothetical protein